MNDDDLQRQRLQEQADNAYRAIGRYIVAFSQLVYRMRAAMTEHLGKGPGTHLAELAIGEAPAQQIANSFFAVCSTVARFDHDDDLIVARRLRQAVNDVITRRNDIAHGDWWIWAAYGADSISSSLVRLKTSRGILKKLEEFGTVQDASQRVSDRAKSGAPRSVEHPSAADLEAESDVLVELTNLVTEFGWIALGGHHVEPCPTVRDIFVVRDKRVVRDGPRAASIPFG